jgi:acyl carrier protein
MTGSMSQCEADVRALIARILGVPLPDGGPVERRHVPEWDSLKHMEIIFALEDGFDVQFDESEFARLVSPRAICDAIASHRAA